MIVNSESAPWVKCSTKVTSLQLVIKAHLFLNAMWLQHALSSLPFSSGAQLVL